MLEAGETGALRHVPIRDGDLVCLSGEPAELYSVILVREGRCWLRNLQTRIQIAELSQANRTRVRRPDRPLQLEPDQEAFAARDSIFLAACSRAATARPSARLRAASA